MGIPGRACVERCETCLRRPTLDKHVPVQVHQSARRRNGERFVGLAGPEDGVARADWQEYRTSTLEDALRGMQPHLTAGDWHRLREANYYGKYALEGAYGWTGWVASSCWDPRRLCICRRPSPSAPGAGDGRCRAASLGRHVAGAVRGCRGLLRCSPGLACAACDVSVFLRLTDVDVPDLVIFNDTAQVHRPAYFVCVDRGRKALVVTVKGSTSINDFITDMDATNVPFPQVRPNRSPWPRGFAAPLASLRTPSATRRRFNTLGSVSC